MVVIVHLLWRLDILYVGQVYFFSLQSLGIILHWCTLRTHGNKSLQDLLSWVWASIFCMQCRYHPQTGGEMCRACMKFVVNANPLWNLMAVIRACILCWLKCQEMVQCLTLGTCGRHQSIILQRAYYTAVYCLQWSGRSYAGLYCFIFNSHRKYDELLHIKLLYCITLNLNLVVTIDFSSHYEREGETRSIQLVIICRCHYILHTGLLIIQ